MRFDLAYICECNFFAPKRLGPGSWVIAAGGYPGTRVSAVPGRILIDMGLEHTFIDEALLLEHGRFEPLPFAAKEISVSDLVFECTDAFTVPKPAPLPGQWLIPKGEYAVFHQPQGTFLVNLVHGQLLLEEAVLLKHGVVRPLSPLRKRLKHFIFKCHTGFEPESSKRSWFAAFEAGHEYVARECGQDAFHIDIPLPSAVTVFVTEEEVHSHGELVECTPVPPLENVAPTLCFDRTFLCLSEFALQHDALAVAGERQSHASFHPVLVRLGAHPAAELEGRGFYVLDLPQGKATVDENVLHAHGTLSLAMEPPEVPGAVGGFSLLNAPVTGFQKKASKFRESLSERLLAAREAVPLGLYVHSNGTVYRVVGYTLDTETNRALVSYREPGSLEDETFSRPFEMFDEIVKWPDKTEGPRFKPYEE